MPFQLNIWLLLAGALQGLLLSIVLLKKKTYRYGYAFLLAYLLVLLAQVFFKVADKQWLMEGVRNTYILSYKFPLLYGPLIWLFVKDLLGPSRAFRMQDSLHFLPFVFCLLLINFPASLGSLYWLNWVTQAMPAMLLQIASLSAYHFSAWRLWQQHKRLLHASVSDVHVFQTRWLRRFIGASLLIGLSICVLTYFIYAWYPAHNWLRFGFLLLCLFIYWISYSAMQQPAMFTAFVNEKKINDGTPPLEFPEFIVHRPLKKYAHSTLNDEEALRIMTNLAGLMRDGKLYSDAALTIEKLANRLHCNRYLLSQVLNERLGQTFYEYVNSWRVENAKEMLLHPDFAFYKMAAIGYEAGFNSLSTFNDVFKKRTGLSPSQFKKQVVSEENKRRV